MLIYRERVTSMPDIGINPLVVIFKIPFGVVAVAPDRRQSVRRDSLSGFFSSGEKYFHCDHFRHLASHSIRAACGKPASHTTASFALSGNLPHCDDRGRAPPTYHQSWAYDGERRIREGG